MRTYPLSWQQEWLWLHAQLDPRSAVYNNPVGMWLRGALDVQAFDRALASIVERHEVLRYVFESTNDGVRQSPLAHWGSVAVDEIRANDLASAEHAAHDILEREARLPFDLGAGPPIRARIVRWRDSDSWVALTLHHLVSDAWSVSLLVRELREAYASLAASNTLPRLEACEQYGDFAVRQRSALADRAARSAAFWRPKFQSVRPLMLSNRTRPADTFAGGSHPVWLDASLMSRVAAFATRHHSTPFAVLLTALTILLHRYTRERMIAIWVPMAGRTHLGLESMFGLCAVTLPIVTTLSSRSRVAEALAGIAAAVVAAQDHQDLSYESMASDSGPIRLADGSGQVMFSFNPLPESPIPVADLEVIPMALETGTAKCDLELNLRRAPDGVRGVFEYRASALTPEAVARLATSWQLLVEAMVEQPSARVRDLPMVTEATRAALVAAAYGRVRSEPWSFLEAFSRHAASTPRAIALDAGAEALTYAELDRRSSAVARALTRDGVGIESVVSLHVPRSIAFLVAMLGVFKAGAAYVPLDPGLPAARALAMRRAAGSRVVLAPAAVLRDLGPNEGLLDGAVALDLDAIQATPHERSDDSPRAADNQLAYVIFTSGSTGTPKGAMVEHAGMANHLLAKIEELALGTADIVAQTASTSFDISVWQFLAALAVGGRVHVVPDDVVREPRALLRYTAQHGITVLETVPSMLRAMLDGPPVACSALRWMIPTGEALAAGVARLWFDRHPTVPLLNAYGPTECSDDVTHAILVEAPAVEAATVPIGHPLRNLAVHVLDDRFEPVPHGASGGIFVGGVGVGRGYVGEPVRTAEAFVPDPFAANPGARLYCTGDLGRIGESGAIEYLGRTDRQVKIRGFRIEPGEIEAQLLTHPRVREAAVVVTQSGGGDSVLVGYVSATDQQPLDLDELRSRLGERLPAYMVPNSLVALERLPRTTSDKIDRVQLESRSVNLQRRRTAPRTDAEAMLAAIWAEILDVPQVGVDDDFFESGGNSLVASRVIARIVAQFGVTLPLRAVFEAPTIAHLVARIVQARANGADPHLVATALADIQRATHDQ